MGFEQECIISCTTKTEEIEIQSLQHTCNIGQLHDRKHCVHRINNLMLDTVAKLHLVTWKMMGDMIASGSIIDILGNVPEIGSECYHTSTDPSLPSSVGTSECLRKVLIRSDNLFDYDTGDKDDYDSNRSIYGDYDDDYDCCKCGGHMVGRVLDGSD